MATLYIDFENGNDNIGLVDYSPNPKTFTANGSADFATTTGKWEGSCASFGSSSGFQTPDSADFTLGSQFTIEMWAYLTTSLGFNSSYLASHADTTNSRVAWHINISGFSNSIAFSFSPDGTTGSVVSVSYTNANIAVGVWNHIAVDRDSTGAIRVYLNGVPSTPTTNTTTIYNSAANLVIGNLHAMSSNCYFNINDFRFTNNVARYGGAFTPPTATFPRDSSDPYYSNVVALLPLVSGTTYWSRWKSITGGAASTRINPGDEIRVMASLDETLVGNATWGAKTITLPAAVTANISTCETLWTAMSGVTASLEASTVKEGTKSCKLVFGTSITGLAAYFATGALDLSGYQQVSFWIYSSAATTSTAFTLRLCSDTAGATTVHTIPIPALAAGSFFPVTVDTGGPLSASINSVALYAAAPGTPTVYIDNIIACKAPSAPDSLTLTSIIGKVYNRCWTPNTAYSLNDMRKPSQLNRNGMRYKVTTAGTSGATEPTWPDIVGSTVTDGGITWTCDSVEETWLPIQSINGTTVSIDNYSTVSATTVRGYAGTAETVATYKRDPIKGTYTPAVFGNFAVINKAGTQDSPITFSGGWDRSTMTSVTGETWTNLLNCGLTAFSAAADKTYIVIKNLNFVHANSGLLISHSSEVYNCHFSGCASLTSSTSQVNLKGVVSSNSNNGVIFGVASGVFAGTLTACRFDSGPSDAISIGSSASGAMTGRITNLTASNNGGYAINNAAAYPMQINGFYSNANASGSISSIGANMFLTDALIGESTEFAAMTNYRDIYIYSQNHDRAAGSHYILTDGGSIVSATDQRHTASGIAWKFRPTSTIRGSTYPLKLSVAKIALAAGTPVNVSIWCYRNSTSISGMLYVAPGQVQGVYEKSVICSPAVNTWVQSNTLTLNPTVDGVVEILFKVWDGVGTTNNFWIDDLVIA